MIFDFLVEAFTGSFVSWHTVILDTHGLDVLMQDRGGLPDLCWLAVSRPPEWQETETPVTRRSYPTTNKLLPQLFFTFSVWTKQQ